jgi:hypothetical protein
MLRDHPALSARLFHLKQECIWDCLLLGESKPIGHIVDYWRRIEVTASTKYKFQLDDLTTTLNSFRCEGHRTFIAWYV